MTQWGQFRMAFDSDATRRGLARLGATACDSRVVTPKKIAS